MSLPWFRLYHRMVDDEKLRLLAFEDRWHFVALCCLKADGLLDEPESDLRNRKIAVKLGVQVRELEEVARRLREVELIDEMMAPIAWDELQQKSDNDSTAAERQRRKRQKDKALEHVTEPSRVTVTDVTRLDIDKDIDKEEDTCASGDALKPEHIFERWNEVAGHIGRPKVLKLSPSRRQLLKGRISQHPLPDFITVFNKVLGSAFLRGDQKWAGVTFDWLFKSANFQKVLEGNYDG